jgi:hypothetical protein
LCSVCYANRRREDDVQFRIACLLRSRLHTALRRLGIGKTATSSEYGIDYDAISAHLGPCPGSRGEWHIDHIKPIRSFDLRDPDQVRLAFAPGNHQWLPAFDNLKKGGNA